MLDGVQTDIDRFGTVSAQDALAKVARILADP
jgi:hypothetical protein